MATVYQLHIAPGEYDSDDKDCDEWFSSLRAAVKRRNELIDEDPHMKECRDNRDYKIERITLAKLPVTKREMHATGGNNFRASLNVLRQSEPGWAAYVGLSRNR